MSVQISSTRHALTGAEAVRLLSCIRAILWRQPTPWHDGSTPDADTFDPDKEQNIESLEAIVGTLEDAGLAPLDWSEYQDVVLRREPSKELEHAQLDRDRLASGVLTCLEYPRGSEAEYARTWDEAADVPWEDPGEAAAFALSIVRESLEQKGGAQ